MSQWPSTRARRVLAALLRIQAAIDEWRRDPATARPWADIKAEWLAAGLLDAN